MSETRRVVLTVEYDGFGLSGWQRQQDVQTVQQYIETVLSRILNNQTQVVGASRTDAGVSARGQVCHFDTDRAITLDGIVRGLNSLLPAAISIASARVPTEDFHARFSARGKDYRYLVWNRPTRSALLTHRVWHVPTILDLELMRAAAHRLVGEHDFSAFRSSHCSAKTAKREIYGIAISGKPGQLVGIDVRGNAFLHNMVRIIAGTLIEVGRGRLSSCDVSTILESRDRTTSGPTAPASGLSLLRVHYQEPERCAPRPITNHDDQMDLVM